MIIGFDPAWGGIGWAIADADGPHFAGHLKPGTWREAHLVTFLRGELEQQIAEVQAGIGPDAPPMRVVVERLPWSYRRPGSQVRTVYGISGCAHVIVGWGCREGWGYPWQVPPTGSKKGVRGWRQWWGIRGKGRTAKKRHAVQLVKLAGWGAHLVGHAEVNDKGDGAQGDLAEGILIAVGAARNLHDAPKGPRKWPR